MVPFTLAVDEVLFEKLQRLGKAFIDTPQTVIEKLADEELERRGDPGKEIPQKVQSENAIRLDPITPLNLAHTKVIAASISGRELNRPKWASVREHMHIVASKKLATVEQLQEVSGANLRKIKYEKEGFKFLPDAGISIQGVDANLAWSHSLRLARKLGIPIKIEFQWRDKEGAAHPGKRGVLEWEPEARIHDGTPYSVRKRAS
jgi:hypothetical protein